MAYAVFSVVFGEQPSAAKWNILGTNDASFNDGTGIADGVLKPEHLKNGSSTLNSWVWDDWTATLTNATNVNGTIVSKYIRIGDTVHFRFSWTMGSSSTVSSDPGFSLPLTAVSYDVLTPIATLNVNDATGDCYNGFATPVSTTVARMYVFSTNTAASKNAQITSTFPVTFTTSDRFIAAGTYQAAA